MASCDIFCTVIDNLGDAGVCWRLARQLATEQAWAVRLWIDDPAPIGLLAPDHPNLPIEVCQWTDDFDGIEPAQVVIEAFACDLPATYLAAMSLRPQPPVWLNLEYLSAENWVASCHGLPSPHPQLPLTKYFFFPGFVAGTGGLLREQDYAVPPVPRGFPSVTPTFGESLEVSLFCYDNPALPALLDCWRDNHATIVCHVATGLPCRQVEAWLGEPFLPGATVRRGRLMLHALPFLPQTEYDALLARCQLNFVRGEDSFVRAQWAERAFVWQAYPQAENAHWAKLDAFLRRYAPEPAANRFFHAWNGDGPLNWLEFSVVLPSLTARASSWSRQLSAHGDLVTNLVKFCAARL
jgi:uncharacterized repeat protein (TIGR03837 family)